ncbi:hypothetical protein LN344_05750 [Lacticaseibacillus paracasei subsp. paracasei]|uniref:hypothetical protein n=1 Tax=Lacticaseibacillus paracasei TaxID=1597 RepID=UPI0005EB7D52|nr:hypothetical protein [Lacticaseibacillus paracasei]MCD0432899.1 hypothetical protein [Lacticaseibacillus paracasei subsp. paracasei]
MKRHFDQLLLDVNAIDPKQSNELAQTGDDFLHAIIAKYMWQLQRFEEADNTAHSIKDGTAKKDH